MHSTVLTGVITTLATFGIATMVLNINLHASLAPQLLYASNLNESTDNDFGGGIRSSLSSLSSSSASSFELEDSICK